MPGAPGEKGNTMTQPMANSEATKTLKIIEQGNNAKLKGLIPEGQSPKLYLDLIKAQIMGVDKQGQARPDDDLLLFLYTAKRTGLDPLTNQIYAVYRWDNRLGRERMTIQTGIDGMRLVAQRSNNYAGQTDVIYTPEDESTQYPTKATVTVFKVVGNARVSFTASARWSEYAQYTREHKLMGLWGRMPYLMLGKCAEALALRKAFPNELSGIYAQEEMPQTQNILNDLPTPAKFAQPKPQVIHGAPTDTIGTDAAKKVTEEKRPAAKPPANPVDDITRARETIKKRIAEQKQGVKNG